MCVRLCTAPVALSPAKRMCTRRAPCRFNRQAISCLHIAFCWSSTFLSHAGFDCAGNSLLFVARADCKRPAMLNGQPISCLHSTAQCQITLQSWLRMHVSHAQLHCATSSLSCLLQVHTASALPCSMASPSIWHLGCSLTLMSCICKSQPRSHVQLPTQLQMAMSKNLVPARQPGSSAACCCSPAGSPACTRSCPLRSPLRMGMLAAQTQTHTCSVPS